MKYWIIFIIRGKIGKRNSLICPSNECQEKSEVGCLSKLIGDSSFSIVSDTYGQLILIT